MKRFFVPLHGLMKKALSIFEEDSEDDSTLNDISRQQQKSKNIEKSIETSMDPSLFLYDEYYDEIREKNAKKISIEDAEKRPKYIKRFLENAEERRIEKEKQVIKKNRMLNADEEGFITSAYQSKLQELVGESQDVKEENKSKDLKEEKSMDSIEVDKSKFLKEKENSSVQDVRKIADYEAQMEEIAEKKKKREEEEMEKAKMLLISRINTEESVMSARERYLARKNQSK